MYNTHYRDDLPLARAGMQHLQRAATLLAALSHNPLDAHTVSQAQQEFASALKTFVQLNGDLESVPQFATLIPVYGGRFSAALHLASLALALSQAGVTGCDILNLLIARLNNPLQGDAHGITAADLVFVASGVHQIQSSLTVALNEVNQVQPGDVQQIEPRMSRSVDALRRDAPMLQGWLGNVEKLLPAAPTLLGIGAPTNYLIEVLDSTELRPGGGFIGNYGTATLSGGQLTTAHITDVDLLDKPFEAAGNSTPFPPAYSWFDISLVGWGLRDSNLDADFPTAARAAELNYEREGGTVPVQGVVAITPALIQRVMAITGPIAVPEYQETVNAQNLIARIHYHQLGPAGQGPDTIPSPDGHSSLRKRFTELLAEHLLARVRQLASSDSSRFLQLMISGVLTKDVQIYSNISAAEALLHSSHLDAAIQPSPGDDFFVVDANISPNKANSFMQNIMTDMVTIDTEGNAIHHTTLQYAWTIPGQNYGSPTYRDYARVYVPHGSVLQTQNGWQARGSSEAFGHEVWAGFFTLSYGQTNTVTLVWTVPHAASHDAHGWHYQKMIQRQAGVVWMVHVQVELPACAVLTHTVGGLKPAGKRAATLNESLTENTALEIDYTC